MSIERDGVARATSRGAVGAFIRVVSQPDRRIVAVADGHTCGWDGGIEEISGAVLLGIDRAIADNPRAPLEVLFEAAREEFLRAAEPHLEDDYAGGPAAQLTVIELAHGRLRAGKLGCVEALVVRDGLAQGETEPQHLSMIVREPVVPTMVEMDLRDGDLIVLSYKWIGGWRGRGLSDVIEDLVRAHSEPRELVAAAMTRWKDDVRQWQEAGTLIGEPRLAIAATRA